MHKEVRESKTSQLYLNKQMVMAVYFWVRVTNSGLKDFIFQGLESEKINYWVSRQILSITWSFFSHHNNFMENVKFVVVWMRTPHHTFEHLVLQLVDYQEELGGIVGSVALQEEMCHLAWVLKFQKPTARSIISLLVCYLWIRI